MREASASETLVARDAILGRVIDGADVSVLCGVHPRVLTPLDAAGVVERARRRIRLRHRVPTERLREEAFARSLIRWWEEAVVERDRQARLPMALHNTDGDSLLLTTDHFEIAPGARAAVEAALARLDGVQPPDEDDDPPAYRFTRPGNAMHGGWETTLLGRASVTDTALRVESNSRERADALRARVEAACGDRIRHRAREHADPMSSKAPHQERPPAPEPVPPEAEQILLQFKERHYGAWPDEKLPALGGKTPREATGTAQGRAAVDALLKDMENHEQRSAQVAPFDFSPLRRELGLD